MASSCSHWVWSAGQNYSIACSGRLRHLTSTLPPENPAPSLILTIGCRQRPQSCQKPKRQAGRLCLDRFDDGDVPLLLATATLHRRAKAKIPCCRPEKEHEISGCASRSDVECAIYSRLLYPFVDVFCFYSYGWRDLKPIARMVASWMQMGQPYLRHDYRPHLLIVLEGSHRIQLFDTLSEYFSILLAQTTALPLGSFFADIDFLPAHDGDALENIRPRFRQSIEAVRKQRQAAHALFSVEHSNSFFDRAFDATDSPSFPFDFVTASRQDFPVAADIATHLANFLDCVDSSADILTFAAPVIASSLLLDQYPPGMHLFKPEDTYHQFYRSACLQAAKTAFNRDRQDGILLPSALTDSILTNLKSLFMRLVEGEPAAAVHRATLARFRPHWRQIQNKQACLGCLTRPPQHKVSCGHMLCENCVQVFGSSGDGDPWLFNLDNCVICGAAADMLVRVRPPTAGHGILCIEGGGTRGIISVTILEDIQESLGLPIPIQEHFTLAYGVSAGALIISALFMNGWSAATCAGKFEELAKVAFRPVADNPLLRWIYLLISDALYPAKGIEDALKQAFGERNIADSSYATTIGTKVGIPATSIIQPSTYLFTNYNGIGGARTGYTVVREEVKIWEAARSSSAAPIFFPPKYISGLGTFQDAGVLRINPVPDADSEFKALYGDARPDYIIDVGTGSPPSQELEDARPRGFLKDGWLARLTRGYESLMQGLRIWNEYTSLVRKGPKEDGYYRLDITLDDAPSLDDTTTMSQMKSLVRGDRALQKTIDEIAQRFFATLFYFELTMVPRRSKSGSSVGGQILCIRKAGDPALPKILQRFRNCTILINGKPWSSHPVEDALGNIAQSITFTSGSSASSSRSYAMPNLFNHIAHPSVDGEDGQRYRITLMHTAAIAARCHALAFETPMPWTTLFRLASDTAA